MTRVGGKAVIHLAGRVRRVVDADDLYYVEARGDETLVRLREGRPLRDVRSLGEVLDELAPLGFVRVHRNHAIHAGHVREIRPAASGPGWEVRLEPPVDKVLPVSRRSLAALLTSYGAGVR